MSGNGMKGKGYTELATALSTEFSDRPKCTAKNVESRISCIKTTYQKCEFIRGKTGAGWDNSRKCPDNEDPVYIDSFVAVCAFIVVPSPSIHLLQQYGDKYKAYFGKPFIYYDRASKLFGRNSATGDNVYHPKKARKKSVEKSTDNPAKPSTKSRPR
ncbi:hypothetical protein B0H14DRAFT_2739633 [Mycena olivaceomarginata]|nr:hypothetical protein B0H14DRAFT_2739633 [Mycena olivaceomarginata]